MESKCAKENRDQMTISGTAVQIHKSLKWGELPFITQAHNRFHLNHLAFDILHISLQEKERGYHVWLRMWVLGSDFLALITHISPRYVIFDN